MFGSKNIRKKILNQFYSIGYKIERERYKESKSIVVKKVTAMQKIPFTPRSSMLLVLRNKVAIPYQALIRIEGRGNYTEFFLQNGKTILTSKTISYYEPFLPSFFLKVKKGCIINCYYLITTQSSKINALRMLDGTCVEVSQRKRTFVKRYYNQIKIGLKNSQDQGTNLKEGNEGLTQMAL